MRSVLVCLALVFFAPLGAQAQTVGKPAPNFTLQALNGPDVTLSAFRGQTVVLEWTSHSCPYTGKHYLTGNMQALQKQARADGIIWLSILSDGAAGTNNMMADQIKALEAARNAVPAALLLDPGAKIARAYGARVTPTMVIIDADGIVRYWGAIDDQRTVRPSSVEGAHNYVAAALKDLKQGQPVENARTRPYGCAVKY